MFATSDLRIAISPAGRRPTTEDLAVLKTLRDGINAIESLRTQSAPLITPGALRGEPQNAIDWSQLLVSATADVSKDVTAALLSAFLVDWLRQLRDSRRAARTLILRARGMELVLEDPTEDDVAELRALLQRWLDEPEDG